MDGHSSTGRDTVLLDVDGTLVDSTYQHALAWWRAFAGLGVGVPVWRIHRSIGMGGDRLVGEVAGAAVEREYGDELRRRWKAVYDAEYRDDVRPFDGAADLVRELHRRGWKVVLASSGKADHTQRAVDLLGVAAELAAVTTGDDADESKPAPDILAVALGSAGGHAAVCVGDSPYDVRAAAALGAPCLGVLTGGFSRAELTESGAAVVVADVAELLGSPAGDLLAEPGQMPLRVSD